jgi:deoxyribodipyrimidine photo-lyase
LRRWAEFVDSGLDRYAADRNLLTGTATSRMSAHLHLGTIHPLAAKLDTRNWRNWNRNFDAMQVDDGPLARQAFDAWKTGRTGYPIVDAGLRQLGSSGFLPNRIRMITASFVVKDLSCHGSGARVGSSTSSSTAIWLTISTAGNGAQDQAPTPRPISGSSTPSPKEKKFDPAGEYVKRWVLELADVQDVHAMADERPADYPPPIVDHAHERSEALRRYGLIS